MLGYVIRRVLFAIPIALGVSVVCFSLVYLAPGDPVQIMLPTDGTAETIAIVKHAYGFDRPIPVQYAIWLWHVLHGDFGRSIASQRAVTQEVFGSLAIRRCWRCHCRSVHRRPAWSAGWLLPGRVMTRTGVAVIGVSLRNWAGPAGDHLRVEFMVLPPAG